MRFPFNTKSSLKKLINQLSIPPYSLKNSSGKMPFESPLDCKEIQPVHPKGNQSWIFIGRTDAEAEIPILWPADVKIWLTGKDPDAGRDWGGGEGDDRGWDSWMASLTQWTWVWVYSGSWWWTRRPGLLQSMGLQRFGHDWATELNWTERCLHKKIKQDA